MRTFKYRLYPTKHQQDILWFQASCLNKLYNFFLNLKKNTYQDYKISLSKADLDKILTDLKLYNPSLKLIHSQVLQQASRRLDQTFKNFMNSKFGFPKFRSNKNFFGILYPQAGYTIHDKYIQLSKIGNIKYNKHRDFTGNIKQIYISRDNQNKWFISITTDENNIDISKEDIIGLDLGISKFATLSNGYNCPKLKDVDYFDNIINKLKSRRDKYHKKKSRKFKELSLRIKSLYGVKNRKINDFLHKVSRYLSRIYDTVVIEDLNIKSMSETKNTGLNREIRNVCWSRFITFLKYKVNRVIEVSPYNTSKKCSNCGKIHNLKLSDRTMNCDCGLILDRDHNAAINILCLGQAFLEKECSTVV